MSFDEIPKNLGLWKDRHPKILLALKIYFILFTASGFLMFICEETMQMNTFAAFSYGEAEDYTGLATHVHSSMKPIHESCSALIKYIGWLNPIMYPAYLEYIKVDKAMVQAQSNLAQKKLMKGGNKK